MWWLLGSVAAWAHPLGGAHFGHDVTVFVAEQAVEVRYVAEVPGAVLLEDWTQTAPTSEREALERRTAGELATGLVLEADGSFLPLAVQDTAWDYGETVVVDLLLAGTLPQGAGELRVSNGNHPDALSVYRTQVSLGPDWSASTSGELGEWRQDEAYRELSITLVPTSPWQALWAPERRDANLGPPGPPRWLYGLLGALLGVAVVQGSRMMGSSVEDG